MEILFDFRHTLIKHWS